MYMFISQERPINQLGLFEKPRILIVDISHHMPYKLNILDNKHAFAKV
jgi:hypothetical protein